MNDNVLFKPKLSSDCPKPLKVRTTVPETVDGVLKSVVNVDVCPVDVSSVLKKIVQY